MRAKLDRGAFPCYYLVPGCVVLDKDVLGNDIGVFDDITIEQCLEKCQVPVSCNCDNGLLRLFM